MKALFTAVSVIALAGCTTTRTTSEPVEPFNGGYLMCAVGGDILKSESMGRLAGGDIYLKGTLTPKDERQHIKPVNIRISDQVMRDNSLQRNVSLTHVKEDTDLSVSLDKWTLRFNEGDYIEDMSEIAPTFEAWVTSRGFDFISKTNIAYNKSITKPLNTSTFCSYMLQVNTPEAI